MEYHVQMNQARVDIDAVEQQLLALDPAGMVDLDPVSGQLRISTLAPHQDVAGVLAAAGCPVELRDIELQPSICCGGCSG